MPIKKAFSTLVIFNIFVHIHCVAQGSFVNLDFEGANVSPLPPGQTEFVSSLNALPGWTCYLGTNEVMQASHNSITTGAANVGILGPNFSPNINGQFTAVLQDGGSPAGSRIIVSAAIAQTGTVPSSSQSILIKASPGLSVSYFTIMLAGTPVTMYPLTTTATFTLFGGNISQYASQIAELRISSLAIDYPLNSGFWLDDIVFSNQPIPEPRALGLFGLGAGLLGWRLRRRR